MPPMLILDMFIEPQRIYHQEVACNLCRDNSFHQDTGLGAPCSECNFPLALARSPYRNQADMCHLAQDCISVLSYRCRQDRACIDHRRDIYCLGIASKQMQRTTLPLKSPAEIALRSDSYGLQSWISTSAKNHMSTLG